MATASVSMPNKKQKRRRKEATYRSFALQKPLPTAQYQLRSAWQLTVASWLFFKKFWYYFLLIGGIICLIALLTISSGTAEINLAQEQVGLRQQLGSGWQTEFNIVLNLLPKLFTNVSQQVGQSLFYLFGLSLIASLIGWWLLRRLKEPNRQTRLKVQDGFYFGSAQLIPYALLIGLLFLQLLPSLIVLDFANDLRLDGVLSTNLEQLGALVIVLTLFTLSGYWLVSGVFSLIIVSLPGTRPFAAWQTACDLTHRLRWGLIGRLLVLGILLVAAVCVILLPFLFWIPQFADLVFYFIFGLLFLLAHIYCFLLYEDLLNLKTKMEKAHD